MGAALLSFCLMLLTTNHLPDKRKMMVQVGSSVKVWQVRIKSNINGTNWNFLLSGRCFLYLPRPCFSDGRKFGKKWKRKNEKTMVGFGRTEKWLSLSCIEFRALSHGHGFRGPCFNGVRKSWVFHDFWTVFLIFLDTFF